MHKTDCGHPKHNEYLKAFLKKYLVANKDAHFSTIMVDPEEWFISDEFKKNTIKCCQMCGISESITRAPYRNISTSNAFPV